MTSPPKSGWEQVRQATTKEEREAIYRFRYTIYVEELKRQYGGVDHERRMLHDEADEDPKTIHLYVGTSNEVLGSMRVVRWRAGDVPDAIRERYSVDLLTGAERIAGCELGRLMVRPSARGRFIVPSLLRDSCAILTADHGTQLAFGSCRPGLLAFYQRLGFRPYAGRMIVDSEGFSVPMVIAYSNAAYLERLGAPMADPARQRFPDTPPELAALAAAFRQDDEAPFVTDPERVWLDMQSELMLGTSAAPALLTGLGSDVVRRLAAFGLVVDIPAGTLVTREGHVEREMFVILDGTFEAFSGDHVYSQMTRGDTFGEIAFFRDSGARSASVRAVTSGKLVVLRRSVLAELARVNPEDAHTLLFNLARILKSHRRHHGDARPHRRCGDERRCARRLPQAHAKGDGADPRRRPRSSRLRATGGNFAIRAFGRGVRVRRDR
jgi:CRP-like cAMP-binding protein/predicted GNAT family N-acyltransferase